MDEPHKIKNVEYRSWEFPQLNELTKGIEKNLLEHSKDTKENKNEFDSSKNDVDIDVDSITKAAFQEGVIEGIRQEKNNISMRDARISDVIKSIDDSKKSLSKDIEQKLLNLLSKMLSVIFQLEVSVDFKHLEQAVIQSISALEIKDKLYLYFNAKTVALVQENDSELSSINDIEIVEDDSLSDGECKIKMDKSFIEIDLSKKLINAIECLYNDKGI